MKRRRTLRRLFYFRADKLFIMMKNEEAVVASEPDKMGSKGVMTLPRDQSLDALRGFAILTMVLSGAIAYGGVLPAWMYHAQVPPPLHKFNPAIPGITWVDLVFPFFLFSMGAAIPLAGARWEKEGYSTWKVLLVAGRRFVLLTFFALFIYHMRAWVIAEAPTPATYLLSILAFVLLSFMFYDHKGIAQKGLFAGLKAAAFILAIALLYWLPFNKGEGFKLDKVDIIILVLANMAFFGTVVWWLTRKTPVVRISLLLFVMAVFLGAKEEGSWNELLYNYTPVPWMYRFYYLKYLFIILPGTIAGDWLLQAAKAQAAPKESSANMLPLTLLSFGMVWCNVALLFSRLLVLNLVLTVAIGAAVYFVLNKTEQQNGLLKKFWQAGFYLLLLGLFFEAYEGGIKKDSSTYSYYFVTSGLAFFMLVGFYGLGAAKWGRGITGYLSLNGRNPMVAYVAGSLLVTPLLHLTGLIEGFAMMNQNAWTGFLKGVLFTGVVSLITIFFTKRRWFWKT